MTYSQAFTDSVNHLLLMEGGYSNNHADNGGETKWGISKASYPNLDIANLTRAEAIDIYHRDYWEKICGDDLPAPVAFILFDMAVNHGVGLSVKMLQACLHLSVDGVIGAKTKAAASSCNPALLAQRLTAERIKLVVKHPDFGVFGNGWISRYLIVFRGVIEMKAG